MSKQLCIEIGRSLTRVVLLSGKPETLKLCGFFAFPTPPDTLNNGCINEMKEFKRELLKNLADNSISTKNAVFLVTSGRVAVRDVTIPYVKKKQISQLIAVNAKEYFPVDVSRYNIIENGITEVTEDGIRKWKVSLVAIPSEIVYSYKKLADACSLKLTGISYTAEAVINMAEREIREEGTACLKVDFHSSYLVILKNGETVIKRSIGYGILDAVNVLKDFGTIAPSAGSAEGFDILKKQSLVKERFDAVDTEGYEFGVKDDVTESFRSLIENVARILDYLRTMKKDVEIDKICLTGAGAEITGLPRLIANELGVNVEVPEKFQSVSIARNLSDIRIPTGEFFTCIGGSIFPLLLNSVIKTENMGQTQKKGGGAVAFFVICALLSAALIAYPLYEEYTLTAGRNAIEKEIGQYKLAEQVYEESERLTALNDYLNGVLSKTHSAADDTSTVIEAVSEHLPAGTLITGIEADEETISLRFKSLNKEDAASVVEMIGNIKGYTAGNVSDMTEASKNSRTVTYTVTVIKAVRS